MFERWKPIKGYEGLYEVSDWGRVKSLKRTHKSKNNSKATIKEHFLKNSFDGRYSFVCLYKNNKQKRISVHRLVAEAFIPNPNNLPQINHINEDKSDNRACNLEFVTPKQNANHGTRNERISKSKRNNTYNTKTVIQYTLDGEFIKEWPSVMEIERVLNISNSNVCACCNGKYKSTHNFIFKYAS